MNTRVLLNNPASPATSRRRAAITLSLLLAALLNAGAVGMAGLRPTPAVPATQAATRATLFLLPAAPTRPLPTAPGRPPAATQTQRQNPQATPDPTPQGPPPTAAGLVTASTALGALPTVDTLAPPVRFYTFQEVDRAAEPDTDWPIDIDTLDAIGIGRLVFEVMVDDRGSVISCTVLDPSGLPEAARLDLEQRLAGTSLQPALRGGRFVASQRRIELLIEPAT